MKREWQRCRRLGELAREREGCLQSECERQRRELVGALIIVFSVADTSLC